MFCHLKTTQAMCHFYVLFFHQLPMFFHGNSNGWTPAASITLKGGEQAVLSEGVGIYVLLSQVWLAFVPHPRKRTWIPKKQLGGKR